MKSTRMSGRRGATAVKSLAIVADALGASIYATAKARRRGTGAFTQTRPCAKSAFLSARLAVVSRGDPFRKKYRHIWNFADVDRVRSTWT